jgi:hypothetical protein
MGAHRGPTSGGGLRNAKSRKTQLGHKDPQKQLEKERKAGEKKTKKQKNKKTKKVAKGNPVGAKSSGKSLDPRGGETTVQGGGRGKGKGKGGAPRLGHQVNN